MSTITSAAPLDEATILDDTTDLLDTAANARERQQVMAR